MKKYLALAAMIVCLSSSAVHAQQIILSTSAIDAFAGSDLNLNLGDSGSLYVWVNNNSGGTVDAMGLDILSSDPAILEATAHLISNPSSRWFATGPGTLGDLVTGSNAFVLITETGIADGELVLHSEIQFDATALGVTTVNIQESPFGVTVDGLDVNPDFSLGSGTVTVGNAIPEPATGLVVLAACGLAVVRRRRS